MSETAVKSHSNTIECKDFEQKMNVGWTFRLRVCEIAITVSIVIQLSN